MHTTSNTTGRCSRCQAVVSSTELVDGGCPQCGWPLGRYSPATLNAELSPFWVSNPQNKYWLLVPLLFLGVAISLGIGIRSNHQVRDDVWRAVVVPGAIALAALGGVIYAAVRIPRGVLFSQRLHLKSVLTDRVFEWNDVQYIGWRSVVAAHQLNYGLQAGSKRYDILRVVLRDGDEFFIDAPASCEMQVRQVVRSLVNGDSIHWSEQ